MNLVNEIKKNIISKKNQIGSEIAKDKVVLKSKKSPLSTDFNGIGYVSDKIDIEMAQYDELSTLLKTEFPEVFELIYKMSVDPKALEKEKNVLLHTIIVKNNIALRNNDELTRELSNLYAIKEGKNKDTKIENIDKAIENVKQKIKNNAITMKNLSNEYTSVINATANELVYKIISKYDLGKYKESYINAFKWLSTIEDTDDILNNMDSLDSLSKDSKKIARLISLLTEYKSVKNQSFVESIELPKLFKHNRLSSLFKEINGYDDIQFAELFNTKFITSSGLEETKSLLNKFDRAFNSSNGIITKLFEDCLSIKPSESIEKSAFEQNISYEYHIGDKLEHHYTTIPDSLKGFYSEETLRKLNEAEMEYVHNSFIKNALTSFKVKKRQSVLKHTIENQKRYLIFQILNKYERKIAKLMTLFDGSYEKYVSDVYSLYDFNNIVLNFKKEYDEKLAEFKNAFNNAFDTIDNKIKTKNESLNKIKIEINKILGFNVDDVTLDTLAQEAINTYNPNKFYESDFARSILRLIIVMNVSKNLSKYLDNDDDKKTLKKRKMDD